MSTSIPKKLVAEAVRFHGHLGPFLILGLKAGLFANKILTKDYFKTSVTVETQPTPPYSCFIDGVQFVTGCTMGKRNIELTAGGSLFAFFRKEDQKLRLAVKSNILEALKKITRKDLETVAWKLSNQSIHELFDIKFVT